MLQYNTMTIQQSMNTSNPKQRLVEHYYYSESEWSRLGCGPLPAERDRARQLENVMAKGNPGADGKTIKGYN